jgi:hypothetical protein
MNEPVRPGLGERPIADLETLGSHDLLYQNVTTAGLQAHRNEFIA